MMNSSNTNDDSRNNSTLIIERDRGLPIRIECVDDTNDEMETVTLLFAYEFAILDPRESIAGEVIAQDVPSLEYFLLHHVARDIGLLSCETERPVASLSNLQPDEWEREIGT